MTLHSRLLAEKLRDIAAERDRYRKAIDLAIDELMVGDHQTAMLILERALNQERQAQED